MNILRKMEIQTDELRIGDQIKIPLNKLGTFTATAQVVKRDRVLFLFDDYVVKRQMNDNENNEGGYENSDLKKWIENDLIEMFPKSMKECITGLTIPTLGEICGWDDDWNCEKIESDGDRQFPLMTLRRNRIAHFRNEYGFGWLRNATTNSFSSNKFASVSSRGDACYANAFGSYGVRPEFWLKVSEEVVSVQ